MTGTTGQDYSHLNRNGRPKGALNKSTQTFRDTVSKLLEDNSKNVGIWLGRVAEHDPGKALDLMAKLAEYAAPKLSKVEVSGDVEVTHGYAFQIERPQRLVNPESETVKIGAQNQAELPSCQVIEMQPIEK